jgi:serpin B
LGLNILSHTLDLKPTKSAGLCAMNIYHCLSMLAAGSKDKNVATFAQVLGFSPESLNIMITNTLALDRYSKTSSAVDMSSASAIFQRKDFILEEAWKKLILEKFKAELGPLELEPINVFIERETKGKLKDVVKPQDVAQVVMILVTYLYFKAKWADPFESRRMLVGETFMALRRRKNVR